MRGFGESSYHPRALYTRLNDDYKPMHGLCRFLHTGPSIDIGSHKFLPFSIDMAQLFELFVAEFLAKKLPENLKIDIQYHARLVANADLSFRIDLVLRDRISGQPLSVIDTKYKVSGPAFRKRQSPGRRLRSGAGST